MRLYNSIKNATSSLLLQFGAIFFGVISQGVFIRYLGIQYAGISGVLNNVISMLSLAELGVGTAMIYSLYKPMAQNDSEKTKSLMRLYKKSYQTIGIIIACLGCLLIPFSKYLFKDLTVDVNLAIVFILYLCNTVFSYFYTYKRSILYADQKDYITKIIDFVFLVLLNGLQIFALILFKNYYLYLIIKIGTTIGENLYISHIVDKQYPYIKEKNIAPLDKKEKQDILTNIKALFCHKIGSFIVLGTDNLIVSSLVSVTAAGIFGNYQLITKSLMGISGVVIDSVTASMGNLLVLSPEKSYSVFEKLFFFNFAVATITGSCLLNCCTSFMTLFAGQENIFPFYITVIIVVEYYIHSMRVSIGVGKNAAGIYYPDRFVSLWESFVNFTVSLLLVKFFGVAGVILGTIISTLLSVFISVPYLTYKYVYKKKLREYYKKYLFYSGIAIISISSSFIACNFIILKNNLFEFLKNGLLSVIISTLVLTIFTFYSEEYNYFYRFIKSTFNKRKN